MSTTGSQPVFQFSGPTLLEEDMDICRIWQSSPAREQMAQGQSFSQTSNKTDNDVYSWRANLPANNHLAHECLVEGEAKLEAYLNALDTAANELEQFSNVQPGMPLDSFIDSTRASSVEGDLLMWMNHQRDVPTNLSFGLRGHLINTWSDNSLQFTAFIRRLQRLINHTSYVETSVGGVLIGRTVVTWAGDSYTLWRDNNNTEIALHLRTLALSIKSTEAWIQTFVVITNGALKLSLLLGSGAAFMAVPAAWKFVRDISLQMEKLK